MLHVCQDDVPGWSAARLRTAPPMASDAESGEGLVCDESAGRDATGADGNMGRVRTHWNLRPDPRGEASGVGQPWVVLVLGLVATCSGHGHAAASDWRGHASARLSRPDPGRGSQLGPLPGRVAGRLDADPCRAGWRVSWRGPPCRPKRSTHWCLRSIPTERWSWQRGRMALELLAWWAGSSRLCDWRRTTRPQRSECPGRHQQQGCSLLLHCHATSSLHRVTGSFRRADTGSHRPSDGRRHQRL